MVIKLVDPKVNIIICRYGFQELLNVFISDDKDFNIGGVGRLFNDNTDPFKFISSTLLT